MYYSYYNIHRSDIQTIHSDVECSGSPLENKNIQWCRWDEVDNHLLICYDMELSEADALELAVIVANNSEILEE